jgi:predicted RNA-binding Zn ribbon-like protein
MPTRRTDPAPRAAAVNELRLLGGRLSFDFLNTVDPRHGERPQEFLTDFATLARWAVRAGAIPFDTGRRLLDRAEENPRSAGLAFRDALALRERLYQVFSSLAADVQPEPSSVQALSLTHATAMSHSLILPTDGSYEWGWDEDPRHLDRPVWPIVRDACEILTSCDVKRIRECPGPDGCGWIFYDASRNGKRRWCSMDVCGNRAKGRRHYARHHSH